MLFFETIDGDLVNLGQMEYMDVIPSNGNNWQLIAINSQDIKFPIYYGSQAFCEKLMVRLKQLLLAQGNLINHEMLKDILESED